MKTVADMRYYAIVQFTNSRGDITAEYISGVFWCKEDCICYVEDYLVYQYVDVIISVYDKHTDIEIASYDCNDYQLY